jgi:hypothetical protein
MLRLIDDRYNKSFTIQAPHEARVWVGTEFLGACEPHPLAVNEPEDSPTLVEGMSVLLPRVYLYEHQLHEQSVPFKTGDATAGILATLAQDAHVEWIESDSMPDQGFVPALLRRENGQRDFVNIGRADWPTREGGVERRAFLIRVVNGESPVFVLERTENWSDQLYADEGGFWTRRDQWDDFPPRLTGQTKTVWRWYIEARDVDWLAGQSGQDLADVDWFRLPATD